MKKVSLIIIGIISLSMGIIGVVIPILPTTPFLLLSLGCFVKSSDPLYQFITKNKYLAPYVEGFLNENGVPLKAKVKAIILIWITIGFSVLYVIENNLVKLMLIIIASLVSFYLITRKTSRSKI